MRRRGWLWVLCSLVCGVGWLAACDTAAPEPVAKAAVSWPAHFPKPRIPADNPQTPAKVELGRHLFYDVRLSSNQTQSCSSCHLQEKAFSDGKITPEGSTGQVLARNSQALVNVAWNSTLTWGNPILTALEQQILVPIFGETPIELGVGANKDLILQRFLDDPKYQALFADAFGQQPIGWTEVVQALASFVRALVSANSAYDRYAQGDPQALSPAAQRGMDLFFSEELECHHCHGGFAFSEAVVHANSAFGAALFQNTGLYNLGGTGAYPPGNGGVFEVTGKPEDMGRFRAPTLRNIAVTAPYMHDGSIATLDQVLDHYARGGRLIESGPYAGDGSLSPLKSGLLPGFALSPGQRTDLLDFLHSLTDEQFLTDPRFGPPQ